MTDGKKNVRYELDGSLTTRSGQEFRPLTGAVSREALQDDVAAEMKRKAQPPAPRTGGDDDLFCGIV